MWDGAMAVVLQPNATLQEGLLNISSAIVSVDFAARPSPPPTWPEDHQLSSRPTLPQELLKHLMGLVCLSIRRFTVANIDVADSRLHLTYKQHMPSYKYGLCLYLTSAD